MTITYPLSMPSRNPADFTLRPNKVVGRSTSPTTGVAQRYEWQGEWWEADFNFGTQSRANGETFAAWLTSLRYSYGTFLAGEPGSATARGSAGVTPGTPTVSGSHSAQSRTLAIATGLGSVTGYLKAGDYIQLGSGSTTRLHKVLQDASLVAGAATLDIWPALRTSYSNGTTIVVASAKGRFFLTAKPEWTVDTAGIYHFAPVSCMEDLS